MMAVTMSLDDFSITYFTKGAGVNTLSTMLYTELKKGVKPELYALSTILFLHSAAAFGCGKHQLKPDTCQRLKEACKS